MRLAVRLLVVSTATMFVACGGGHAAVPPAQRFPTGAEAPGSKPDPVEKRQTVADLDAFIPAFSPALVNPDQNELLSVFQDAGFQGAGLEVRFFGATHSPSSQHLFSWYIELKSEDDAANILDWLEADGMKPCPQSCAVRVAKFSVDGITDARGVHRVATAEDIQAAGTANEVPSDSYWVGFTVGSIVYSVNLMGSPGSVSEEQAQRIVAAFHDRLSSD